MAPDPQCSALAAAKANKGLSYAQLAGTIGSSEQHIIDICTGITKPTPSEFNKLAFALDIKSPPPHNSAHATA